jgi:hypothetical protein
VVNVISPIEEAVVGGKIDLEFTVTDVPAGVDNSTVKVKMGGTEYAYTPNSTDWTEDNGKFTFRFDTVNIANAVAQVTINVLAADRVQNRSQGDDHTIYLDNQPPIVDLDPGPFRERVKQGEDNYCTVPFDPLGTASANDGQTVSATPRFRALVWERTNGLPTQPALHYSGLNESSVYLYIQPNTTKPLVTDSADDDRICDDVPLDLQQSLTFRVLNPLQPQGESDFGVADTNLPTPSLCLFKGATSPVARLCDGVSDMKRVIDHDGISGLNPVVFAGGQLMGDECTGNHWEILGTVGRQGWVCLAARAKDRLGNVGVSAPLRVCLVTTDPSVCTREAMPSCTDGCQLPTEFGPTIVNRR